MSLVGTVECYGDASAMPPLQTNSQASAGRGWGLVDSVAEKGRAGGWRKFAVCLNYYCHGIFFGFRVGAFRERPALRVICAGQSPMRCMSASRNPARMLPP